MGFFNTRVFGGLSTRSRRKKAKILQSHFNLADSLRILDVGGAMDEAGRQVLEASPRQENITVVNLDRNSLLKTRKGHPSVSVIQADARHLPYGDNAFDLVYSNAVIEHVGELEDQKAMAREVMRVGKSWFVTTPNRWFPFEFHTRLPLVSWLPAPTMKRVRKIWSYNHIRKRYQGGLSNLLRLMTARELQQLFPDSLIIKCRITVWPETLIALGPRSAVS